MITPPDVELWACGWLREHLADVDGIEIDVCEPPDYTGDHPLVIVNDIPGSKLTPVTWDWTLAVTVRTGPRQDLQPAKRLAAHIMGLLTDDETLTVNTPICATGDTTGPTFVTEDHDTARYYLTVDLTVAGDITE